jgi:hypothetical protein
MFLFIFALKRLAVIKLAVSMLVLFTITTNNVLYFLGEILNWSQMHTCRTWLLSLAVYLTVESKKL